MPTGIYVRTDKHLNQLREMAACGAMRKRELRLVAYVVDENGCWLWKNATDGNGYGHLRENKRSVKAYRFFYERKYGKVPNGLELDHLCKTKLCVNPDHLEPVSHQINMQRALAKYSIDDIRFIRDLNVGGFRPSELKDFGRLHKQFSDIRDLMLDGNWRTVQEVADILGLKNPMSVDANIRNLRKQPFGSFVVSRRDRGGVRGLSEYRIQRPISVTAQHDFFLSPQAIEQHHFAKK